MRLDENGNVGIGTTSPEYELDVRNSGNCHLNIYGGATGNTAQIRLSPNNNNDSDPLLYLGAGPVDSEKCVYVCSRFNYPLVFMQNNDEKMRIKTNGHIIVNDQIGWTDSINGNNRMNFNDQNFGFGAGRFALDMGSSTNSECTVVYCYEGSGRVFVSVQHPMVIMKKFSQMSTRMIINGGNGNVGIGTTTPAGKLAVVGNSGGTSFTGLQYTYEGVGSSNNTTQLAVYVNGEAAIYGSLRIASDARIKTNIVDVSDNLALEMVRNIHCRYYEYKDKLNRGTQKTIGFIAQQVKEIMPMAVSINTDIIPNEMRNLTDLSWNDTTLYTDLSDCSGVKYKFYVSNDINGNDERMKEIVGNPDNSFTFDQSWNNVFCYGREVDDFHTLDKQKLFALNFSATQELDRKVTALENENETIKQENQIIKQENEDLKFQMALLRSELTTIKAHLGI